MTKFKFDLDFFHNVLSDWEYKEIYVNGFCIYSCERDVSVTISDFITRVEDLENIVDLCWSDLLIKPYGNGVSIEFKVNMDFKWEGT